MARDDQALHLARALVDVAPAHRDEAGNLVLFAESVPTMNLQRIPDGPAASLA
jgi:hypothetical protein